MMNKIARVYVPAVGIEVPVGFNAPAHDSLNRTVAQTIPTTSDTFVLFAAAWNGVAFRYRQALDAAAAFHASSVRNTTISFEENYHQSERLFSFATSAVSCIENVAFGIYAIGSHVDRSHFPATNPQGLRKVNTRYVHETLRKFYPNHSISRTLKKTSTEHTWRDLLDLRDALVHRGTPPRRHFVSPGQEAQASTAIPLNPKSLPSEWNYTRILDENTFQKTCTWLATSVSELLQTSAEFGEHLLLNKKIKFPPS